MAHVMVKPVKVHELSGLRPSSRTMSIKQKRTSPLVRSRSCQPQFRIRFNTPSRTSNSSTVAESLQMIDSEMEKMLQEKLVKPHITIKQLFQTLDIFNTGTVTQSEFSKVLQNYCDVPMTQQQLKKLLKKVNAINRDGTVSYTRFLQKLSANGDDSSGQDVSKSVGNALCDDDLENQLKSKLLGQFASVVTAMKLFDYNQDGYIQKHELRRVLENYCFKMTNSQFEKLWVKYDKSNNGNMLNYMEFMHDLGVQPRKKEYASLGRSVSQSTMRDDRQKIPSSVGHVVQKSSIIAPQTEERNVEQGFKKKFRTNYEAIRRAVTILDHRAVGFVPMSEFKKIVVSFTVDMSDSLFHSLLERCGVIISHRIHYERFLDFYGEAKTNILWQPEASKAQDDIFTMLRSHVNSNFSSIKDAFLEFDYKCSTL